MIGFPWRGLGGQVILSGSTTCISPQANQESFCAIILIPSAGTMLVLVYFAICTNSCTWIPKEYLMVQLIVPNPLDPPLLGPTGQ